jgi:hypothetical protein
MVAVRFSESLGFQNEFSILVKHWIISNIYIAINHLFSSHGPDTLHSANSKSYAIYQYFCDT